MLKQLKEKMNISGHLPEARTPVFFAPGLFFLAIGLAAIFAPGLILAIIAGFFLFIGLLMCYGAWKFIQFRKNFDSVVQDLQSRISVHAVHVSDSFDEFDSDDDDNIIVH